MEVKSPVRENRPPGSVRGAPGNRRPYRDRFIVNGLAYGAGYGLVQGPGRCRHLPDKMALFKALADLINQEKKE